MLLIRNCIAGILALLAGVSVAHAQSDVVEFVTFAGGRQIGREQVTVGRVGNDWIISSTGRHTSPVNVTIERFEARYSADWQPIELTIAATIGQRALAVKTSFGLTTAVNEITQGGITNSKTDQVSARTIILPNGFFGAYEAVAARLRAATLGTELPIYVAPQAEVKAHVKVITDEQLQSPSGSIAARTYEIVFQNPGGTVTARVTVDARGRLARVEIPAAGLSVVRAELASVSVRQQTSRNPTDSDVMIPALGFNLAGTITMPTAAAGRLRHPAVVLVPGSGSVDRDETVAGIPIFTQLAGALAQQGILVVRYDKRGVGQSGGRTERATIEDFASDVLSVYEWLKKRKDVDRQRISVVGHSEGGAVALIAGAREKDVASLVLVAAPGGKGADLILEQQRHALDTMKVSDAERKAKVDLQQKIQLAVMTGVGWEGIPDDVRQQADTPWFKSLLLFDPSAWMSKVRQPLLIVHGELDKQVPSDHAEKLAALARQRKRKAPVEVARLPGVNHLLVRAATGEVSEYASLKEKTIVPEVAQTIAEFLRR